MRFFPVAIRSSGLSFGKLAASSQPAVRALGLTVAIGVGLSLVLAPAAWLLFQPASRHGDMTKE